MPISRFEFDFTGDKDGTLVTSRDLCRGAVQKLTAAFTGHNGATFRRSTPVGIQGCNPIITASLRQVASPHPKLLMQFRAPAVSTAISKLTLSLPPSLRGKRRARTGVHVVAGKRRISRKNFRLTGRTLVIKKLPAGTHVLKVGLSQGAIKPRSSLKQRVGNGKKTLLSFGIQSIDSVGTGSSFEVKARAKP